MQIRGDTMALITAADNVVNDIKQVLSNQGRNDTSLRIEMTIG
ncbi:MAG: hypothetical protein WBJ34_07245 [Syntrophomonadaceae bacterium]